MGKPSHGCNNEVASGKIGPPDVVFHYFGIILDAMQPFFDRAGLCPTMKLICTLLIVAFVQPISGQKLVYDVVRSGSSMGTTVVERKVAGDAITYYLNTKTEFRVLFSFEVEYELVEVFQNLILQRGSSFNTLNGSMQRKTELKRIPHQYELVVDGIKTAVSETEIRDSVSEVYFEEPYNGKKVYSAYFARWLQFTEVAPHQYSLVSPDGTNVYTYVNGICTEVKISRDFATFSQVLKPELVAAVKQKQIKP